MYPYVTRMLLVVLVWCFSNDRVQGIPRTILLVHQRVIRMAEGIGGSGVKKTKGGKVRQSGTVKKSLQLSCWI